MGVCLNSEVLSSLLLASHLHQARSHSQTLSSPSALASPKLVHISRAHQTYASNSSPSACLDTDPGWNSLFPCSNLVLAPLFDAVAFSRECNWDQLLSTTLRPFFRTKMTCIFVAFITDSKLQCIKGNKTFRREKWLTISYSLIVDWICPGIDEFISSGT